MVFKVFLDANILLDFTLKREKYTSAQHIVKLAESGDIYAFITPAIVHIVAYWLTKAYGKRTSKEIIVLLLADIKVIDANHAITLNAVHSQIDDVGDAIQYFTAIHHKLDYFLTRDKALKKHNVRSLPICDPEEFLKEVYRSY